VKPAQRIEISDKLWGHLSGGSAPGGTVGVPLSTRQALAEIPTGRPNANDSPAHMTGTHRATLGKNLANMTATADPTETGVPFGPNGKRGQSPLVLKQTRGAYRP
jgi:hypothetical protein